MAINLHNVNNELTNSEYALGWAGDWVSPTASANYKVSNVPLENIISSPLPNETYSLINVGFYANGGGDGTNAIGRRLQTSTAGAFYEYEVWQESNASQVGGGNNDVNNSETPFNAATDFFFSGGVGSGLNIDDRFSKTHPASTIRTLGSPAQAHHRVSAGGTHTMNTSIGAQGSTVWLGFLMRLNGTSSEDAYVNLHTNAQPYQIDNTKLSIGYLGTTDPANFNGAGTDKYWGIRINGTSYVNKNPDALIVANRFDLLVVSITFDYTSGHLVNFYAIKDNSLRYDDLSGVDGIIDAPTATVSQSITGTDLSFHSLAYQGGNSVNRSNIDEIRFGRTYDVAALASRTISIVRDLCESGDGSRAGANVNVGGGLGSIASTAANGTIAVPNGDGEFVGNTASYGSVYDPASANTDYNSPTSPLARVMFENGATVIGATTYGALAPGFIYNPDVGGQPNDGNFYVGNQSRNPFNQVGSGNWPVWISTYDNSGTQRGNLMVLNASYDRGLYFEQEVSGICPGTQYEFSADIINLFSRRVKTITNTAAPITDYNCGCNNTLEPGCGQFSFAGTDQRRASGLGAATRGSGSDCFGLNPEVEFLIDGVPVYIPPISIDNDEKWHRVGFTFVTKDPPAGKVTIAVRNRAPGGNGNDLAMDNFQFRPCGPSLNANALGICNASDVLRYTPQGKTFRKPFYRWIIVPCNGPDCFDTTPTDIETNENKWLVVGNKAFFDANDAELRIDTIGNGTRTVDGLQTFTQVFPGNVITTGSLIFVYSASEKEANTLSSTCRINGPAAQVICPLPVTLLSFKAALTEGKVRLDWQTTEEKNAKQFVVERSADGTNFVPIGTVPANAKAGPQNVRKYQYDDYNPLYGTSYYRLKMIDFDAKYEYSNIESVKIEAKYRIYPNPARDVLFVDVDNRNGNGRTIRFTMYNLLGNKVFAKNLEVARGDNKLVVGIPDLSSGSYVVEIADGATVFRKSVVVR